MARSSAHGFRRLPASQPIPFCVISLAFSSISLRDNSLSPMPHTPPELRRYPHDCLSLDHWVTFPSVPAPRLAKPDGTCRDDRRATAEDRRPSDRFRQLQRKQKEVNAEFDYDTKWTFAVPSRRGRPPYLPTLVAAPPSDPAERRAEPAGCWPGALPPQAAPPIRSAPRYRLRGHRTPPPE